jgi:hypothetical protein
VIAATIDQGISAHRSIAGWILPDVDKRSGIGWLDFNKLDFDKAGT